MSVVRPKVAFSTSGGDFEIEFNTSPLDSEASRLCAAHFLDNVYNGLYDSSSINVGAAELSIGQQVTVVGDSEFAHPFQFTDGAVVDATSGAESCASRDSTGAVSLKAPTVVPNKAWTVSYLHQGSNPATLVVNVQDNTTLDKGSVLGIVCGRIVKGREVVKGLFDAKEAATVETAAIREDLLGTCKVNPRMTVETSAGKFVAELWLDMAPLVVSNIVDLAQQKFYDGQHFFRVVKDFVVQMGCPNSANPKARNAGQGGPQPNSTFTHPFDAAQSFKRDVKGKIADEHAYQLSNELMTLSMANSGANTCGSQFFITTKPVGNAQLDWFNTSNKLQHPVFGCIIEGKDIVLAISNAKTKNDAPVAPIQITKVTVVLE